MRQFLTYVDLYNGPKTVVAVVICREISVHFVMHKYLVYPVLQFSC